jgi:hypothetical protein
MMKEYWVHVTQVSSYIVKAQTSLHAEDLVLEGIQEGKVDGDLVAQEETGVQVSEVDS